MTVDESISTIMDRMINGIMFHTQLSHYFNFLGLKGYAECQKYHYYDESKHYINLYDYYICHYNKLITEKNVDGKNNVIPNDWYMFTRFDVDPAIRKNSIKTGMEKWAQWERETKLLLEQHYQSLLNLNEIAIAEKISDCIYHVDIELAKVEKQLLTLKSIDFNISDIMLEQEEVYQKYKKKIKEIKLL